MNKFCTKMNFIAMINSPVSWAKIGRSMYKSMDKICDVNLIEQKGFLFQNNFLKQDFKKKIIKADIDFIIDSPENYKKKKNSDFMIGGIVYEFSDVSKEWIGNINTYLNFLWVPNKFNQKIFLDNGVKIPIIIAPYGVDFYFDNKISKEKLKEKISKDKFLFSTICMPQKRKGLKELLEAFDSEFDENENVKLKIKLPYWKQKSRWDLNISNLIKKYSSEKIEFIKEIMTDQEIQSFIKDSHVYCQPSYSEGFGLSILDALNNNVPVLVNDYGAHLEFCNEKNSAIVKSNIKKMNNILYSEPEKNIEVHVPDRQSLKNTLRRLYEDFDYYFELYNNSGIDQKIYNWDNTCKKIINSINV